MKYLQLVLWCFIIFILLSGCERHGKAKHFNKYIDSEAGVVCTCGQLTLKE
jgi:hypothetical protein